MAGRVLVIEDHPANRKLMASLLRTVGHEVLTAGNGEEGLEIARRNSFDLILCDIRMPGMDGYEVAGRLLCDPAWPKIPLIAVTGLGSSAERDRVLEAGFSGYITKGTAPMQFVQLVQSFLPVSQSTAGETHAVAMSPGGH